MKFNILKTRRGRLQVRLQETFKTFTTQDIEKILSMVDEYEKDNLETIEKFKRKRSVELNKINGALKQAFNAHPVMKKELIGSIGKRIYGALLGPKEVKPETQWQKIKKWWKIN